MNYISAAVSLYLSFDSTVQFSLPYSNIRKPIYYTILFVNVFNFLWYECVEPCAQSCLCKQPSRHVPLLITLFVSTFLLLSRGHSSAGFQYSLLLGTSTSLNLSWKLMFGLISKFTFGQRMTILWQEPAWGNVSPRQGTSCFSLGFIWGGFSFVFCCERYPAYSGAFNFVFFVPV
jgi:hypothetical protein